MALIPLVAASTRWCRGYTLELAKEALFPSLFIFWGKFVQFLLFLWFFFSWLGSQQLLRLTELLKEVKDLSLSQFIQVCIHYIQAHNSIWYVRNKWINKKLHLKKHFKNMGVDLLHFVIFVSITSLTVNSLISFCEILVKFQLNCLIVLASCRINSSFHKGSGLETIIWKYWSTSM